MKQQPRIKNVMPLEPFRLRIEWRDGSASEVDLSKFLHTYKIFRPLREEPALFARAEVGEWGWDVSWGGDMDISVCTLWRLALEQAGEAMRAEEFRDWRKRHNLSLTSAAQTLGLSRRMVAYYDKGERIIPKYVRLACKGAEAELRS